jgi:hypothetical protein
MGTLGAHILGLAGHNEFVTTDLLRALPNPAWQWFRLPGGLSSNPPVEDYEPQDQFAVDGVSRSP